MSDLDKHSIKEIEITTCDRLKRAWENSMELVRDFEMYSKRIEDEKVSRVFKNFAEDEGKHAHKLRDMILSCTGDNMDSAKRM